MGTELATWLDARRRARRADGARAEAGDARGSSGMAELYTGARGRLRPCCRRQAPVGRPVLRCRPLRDGHVRGGPACGSARRRSAAPGSLVGAGPSWPTYRAGRPATAAARASCGGRARGGWARRLPSASGRSPGAAASDPRRGTAARGRGAPDRWLARRGGRAGLRPSGRWRGRSRTPRDGLARPSAARAAPPVRPAGGADGAGSTRGVAAAAVAGRDVRRARPGTGPIARGHALGPRGVADDLVLAAPLGLVHRGVDRRDELLDRRRRPRGRPRARPTPRCGRCARRRGAPAPAMSRRSFSATTKAPLGRRSRAAAPRTRRRRSGRRCRWRGRCARSTSVTARSSRSPYWWPKVSLTGLRSSRSSISTREAAARCAPRAGSRAP